MILFRRQMVNVHVSQQIAFFYYPLYFSSFLPGCSLVSIQTKEKKKKKKCDGQDHDCFIFYVLNFFIFNLAHFVKDQNDHWNCFPPIFSSWIKYVCPVLYSKVYPFTAALISHPWKMQIYLFIYFLQNVSSGS